MIGRSGRERGDGFGQHFVVLAFELRIDDLIVFRMPLFGVPGVPSPAEPGVVALVVAAPYGDRGVVAQTADVVFGFEPDVFEPCSFGGIDAACEHGILPYEDAPFIAQFVENIVFIDASAPDAQHVHIHGCGVVDRLFVDGARDAGQENVAGDVVGAFGEERLSVEFEAEGRAVRDLLAHETQRAQADAGRAAVGDVARRDRSPEFVEMGLSQFAGPPAFRRGDVERNGHAVDAGPERGRDRGFDPFAGSRDRHDGPGLFPDGVDLHLDLHPGPFGRDLLLTVENVADADAVPAFQIDRTPDARGHQARAPVPAVVVTRLAGEDADAFVEESAVGRLIVDGLVTVGQRVVFGQVDLDRRMEIDFQRVFAGTEQPFDLRAPAAEHVVGREYLFVVEVDVGIGVESFEDQFDPFPGEQVGAGFEMRFVDPVFLVGPLYAAFVEAEIGVFDDPVGHQVGVHRAGDRGRIPVVEPCLAELPVVVQPLTDGACGSGEGHAEVHSGKNLFEVFHDLRKQVSI